MRDLVGFRDAVREYRRAVGRTQQQLARQIGLHPDVLSHKLNGTDHAALTTVEVTAIVTTLARWGALNSRAEAERLLGQMNVTAQAMGPHAWDSGPLSQLAVDGPSDPAPGGAERPAVGRGLPAPPSRPRLALAPAPVPPTPLIGRSAERVAVREALGNSRLVTLTGVGGTGKTRLAVQAAQDLASDYARGVAFVDLKGVREPAHLVVAVARSVGLSPRSIEEAEPQLVDALAGQPVLLILDNLEHLLDATPVLGRTLEAAPGVHILATSRIRLHLYGETVLRVPPLALTAAPGASESEAVQLFLQRAEAARADVCTDEQDRAAVVGICAALDGLPLAIELAAARTRLYPPTALLALLNDRLTVLTGGPRDLPHRQQTLRATLEWSYDLLDSDARRLFARLGVFAGPFDAVAAATVDGHGERVGEVLDHLEALCDHSLLDVEPGDPPRFRFLQTVREYALARLAESGDEDAVRQRHLEHYLTVCTTDGYAHAGLEQRGWLDDIERSYVDVRAALRFAYEHPGRYEAGLRLAASLAPLFEHRLSLAVGAWQLDRFLVADARTHTARAATRARALSELAGLECFRGDYSRAATLAEESRVLCARAGDHRGLARAHRFLGEAALAVGDLDLAEQQFRRQLADAERARDRVWEADAYNMLGQCVRQRGRYPEATRLLLRALRLTVQERDSERAGSVMNSLGEVARDAGDVDLAERRFTASLRRHWQVGTERGVAYDLEGLAAVAALRGDGRKCLRYLGAARGLREHQGGVLPPVEQAIVTRILEPALAPLSQRDRDDALADGRDRPLADIVGAALRERSGARR